MDAQKVIEVADLYLRQYGHCLTDEIREQLKKEELDVMPPLTPEALLQGSTKFGQTLLGDEVVARSFPKEERLPTAENAKAHLAAMNSQIPQLLADNHFDKCHRWFGFMCGVVSAMGSVDNTVNVTRDHFFSAAYMSELARDHAAEGKLNEAFVYLGLAQGLLWVIGAYSIEELKQHNKPAPDFVSE